MDVLEEGKRKLNPRLVRLSKLVRLDAPGDKPAPVEERKATILRALRVFAYMAMFIYGGGVVVSHLVFSEDDRAACHSAGGIVGRIWCPESVDTEGFRVHFVKALGWPAHVLRPTAAPAGKFEITVAVAKRVDDTEFTQIREAKARALVSEAQRMLKMLGYKIGDVDGIAGTRTRAAIREFQIRDGMQISGEVTDELVARLVNSGRANKLETQGNR